MSSGLLRKTKEIQFWPRKGGPKRDGPILNLALDPLDFVFQTELLDDLENFKLRIFPLFYDCLCTRTPFLCSQRRSFLRFPASKIRVANTGNIR